jgi:hypothetical protein
MKSRVLDRRETNDLAFHGDALYAVSSTDVCDAKENIVGYRGRIARWEVREAGVATKGAQAETVLVESRKEGFTSVAVLGDGRLAVAEKSHAIALFAPNGARLHAFETSFGASSDWLGVGGVPERLFAATTSSSSQKKCVTVAEIDVAKGSVRHLGFRSTRIPTLGPFGIARIESNKTIAEYAWKGAVKKATGPVFQYGHWSVVRLSVGWFVFRTGGGHLLDLSEKTAWTCEEKLATYPGFKKDDVLQTACAAGADRLLLASTSNFYLVDGATGELLASCKRNLPPTESKSGEGRLVWDGGTRAALPSERGIELLFELPALPREAAAVVAPAAAAQAVPAKKTSKSKTAAKVVDPLDTVVTELERLAGIVCASEALAEVRKAHKQISKLDILEACDEPAREKRIRKVEKALRARRKALGNESPLAAAIESVLDTVSDS